MKRARATALFAPFLLAACGSELPADLGEYRARCARMNAAPILAYAGDPHRGVKNVYACDIDPALVRMDVRPFPDGTIIVKESAREGTDYAWLIATARKQGGAWKWDEYTRNFDDEAFVRIPAGQGVCTGCHRRAEARDWIFTAAAKP